MVGTLRNWHDIIIFRILSDPALPVLEVSTSWFVRFPEVVWGAGEGLASGVFFCEVSLALVGVSSPAYFQY